MTDVKDASTFGTLRSVIASDPYHQQFQPLLDHIDTLTRERDEAREERDYYMMVGFWRLDRIYAVEAQLAAARELMAEAAEDIGYMVNAEYHGPDDVHPAMRAKYTRDMEIVSRLTAALTQGDA
jgi:hypothetical protein